MFEEANAKLHREVYREASGPASVISGINTGSYCLGGKWIAQLIIYVPPINTRNKRSLLNAFCSEDTQPKKI